MTLLRGRRQRPLPDRVLALLESIPDEFIDDGCSNAPDSVMGFHFGALCRIHDWRYCSRCHPAGSMTARARRWADTELGLHLRSILPWRWRWVGWLYRAAVWRYGGISAFDSCGSEAGAFCRHGIAAPSWMTDVIDSTEEIRL